MVAVTPQLRVAAFPIFDPVSEGNFIMKCRKIIQALVGSILATGAVYFANAQSTATNGTTQGIPMAAKPSTDLVDGEVRKIDKDAKKITLKHAEIPNLEMPGMTMVFQVKDPAMLDTVKVGDKVKFQAQKIDGALVVTNLQVEK